MSENNDGKGDCPGEHIVPGPMLSDGTIVGVHHDENHECSPCLVHPLRDGQPIPEDAVLVSSREGSPYLHVDGPVCEPRGATGKAHSGHASPAYRKNWETIFGSKTQVGEA